MIPGDFLLIFGGLYLCYRIFRKPGEKFFYDEKHR